MSFLLRTQEPNSDARNAEHAEITTTTPQLFDVMDITRRINDYVANSSQQQRNRSFPFGPPVLFAPWSLTCGWYEYRWSSQERKKQMKKEKNREISVKITRRGRVRKRGERGARRCRGRKEIEESVNFNLLSLQYSTPSPLPISLTSLWSYFPM